LYPAKRRAVVKITAAIKTLIMNTQTIRIFYNFVSPFTLKIKNAPTEAGAEKHKAPIVAKQNFTYKSISICKNRASVFLPKDIKIHILTDFLYL